MGRSSCERPCPTCGAVPGEPCRRPRGGKHRERRQWTLYERMQHDNDALRQEVKRLDAEVRSLRAWGDDLRKSVSGRPWRGPVALEVPAGARAPSGPSRDSRMIVEGAGIPVGELVEDAREATRERPHPLVQLIVGPSTSGADFVLGQLRPQSTRRPAVPLALLVYGRRDVRRPAAITEAADRAR
jgi:hypothetical protein